MIEAVKHLENDFQDQERCSLYYSSVLYTDANLNIQETKQIRDSTSLGGAYFISSNIINIYTAMDKFMIGWFSSETEVGYYSQIEHIIRMMSTILTSLRAVLLPRIAKLIKAH